MSVLLQVLCEKSKQESVAIQLSNARLGAYVTKNCLKDMLSILALLIKIFYYDHALHAYHLVQSITYTQFHNSLRSSQDHSGISL